MSGNDIRPEVQKYFHEQGAGEAAARAAHRRPAVKMDPARIEELERENTRLQLLVAELLIKNQQLRKAD